MADTGDRAGPSDEAPRPSPPQPDPPKVTVVIRAFNEAAYLQDLLDGIAAQDYPAVETVLVDSGSTDGTVQMAAPYVDRIVHIAPEAFSFGRALNLGCEAATGDVFVFASAHVFPESPTWLAELVRPIREDGACLVYGRQRGDHRSKFSEHQIFHSWFPDHDRDEQDSPFCNNANVAVDRSWWLRVRYDEDLTGLEDIAWAKQVQALGGTIAYRANAGVVHVHEESYERIFNRYRREAIALRHIYPRSHVSVWEAIRLYLAGCWLDIRVAVRQRRRLSTVLGSIVRFRFCQYWGTYRGHNTRDALSDELRRVLYYPPSSSREVRRPEHAPLHGVGPDG